MNISRFLASPDSGRRAIARRFLTATKRRTFIRQLRSTECARQLIAAKNIERTILGQPLKAVSLSNHGDAREHRPSHRRGEHVRIQVLRFHRLVDVAERLSREAAAAGEESARR